MRRYCTLPEMHVFLTLLILLLSIFVVVWRSRGVLVTRLFLAVTVTCGHERVHHRQLCHTIRQSRYICRSWPPSPSNKQNANLYMCHTISLCPLRARVAGPSLDQCWASGPTLIQRWGSVTLFPCACPFQISFILNGRHCLFHWPLQSIIVDHSVWNSAYRGGPFGLAVDS